MAENDNVIITPTLEDVFDVAHNEGRKEAYGKILALLNDGCDLAFVKSYLNMELAHIGSPTIKGVLRNVQLSGNGRSVRSDAPSKRNIGRDKG